MRVNALVPPAVATVTLLLAGATTGAAWAREPSSLQQARQASEENSFDGVLDVQWRDGPSVRVERLTVRGRGGAMLVQGGNEVMARSPFERLLAHRGDRWQELWLPNLAPGPRPDGSVKYQVSDVSGGPVVAGRPTRTVEIRQQGVVRERMYLDSVTSLMLQRDQYGDSGQVVRTLAFETVDLGAGLTSPVRPDAAEHASTPVSLHGGMAAMAPGVLAGDYQRVGVYRSDGVLHALYSDGVYDLSVFEQSGRLRRSDLPPSGERVTVGAATGWRYPWPGGQLLVWSTKGRVLTAVTDAPADQLVLAARSLPELPRAELSMMAKVRRATAALMEPLA
jgi:negative regulator of sigma E activity